MYAPLRNNSFALALKPSVLSLVVLLTALFVGSLALRPAVPSVSAETEQYIQLALPAPSPPEAPGGDTRALALNNSGQVFGIAGVVNSAPRSYVPVVWTVSADGRSAMSSILPPPTGSGYHFNAFAGDSGNDFINDSGTVVSLAVNDAVVVNHPNDGRRPIIWQNGTGTPIILPLPDDPICTNFATVNGVTLERLNSFPVGLNGQGHVLVSACGAFWIYQGSVPPSRSLVATEDIDPSPTYTVPSPILTPSGNHLNNSDQAVLDMFVPGTSGNPLSYIPAIYSLGGSPPLPIAAQPDLASHTINNNDQVLFFFPDPAPTGPDHLELWDGARVVDLGLGGAASLNNHGEVVFSSPFPFGSVLYKDGVISPLNITNPLGKLLINDAGQIAANTTLPSLPPSQPYAVLFTPTRIYQDMSVPLSGDTTVAPSVRPTGISNMNVSGSTDFKGTLEGDPNTGNVRVTNAHPAGTYTITIKAFDASSSATTTKTFTLTVTTPPTCNPVSFAAAANIGVGTRPSQVALGDFNGDGNQDLAVAEQNDVAILLGNGAGGFSAATLVAIPNDFPGSALAVGDFNGDGKQDLAIAYSITPPILFGKVAILLGNGAGNFTAAGNFDTDRFPFSVAVGDFNRDGKQDLAFACYAGPSVSVLLGDGAGNFGGATNFVVGGGPQSVKVGDFNGDGKQDLVAANIGSNNVSVLLGDGAGNFGAATHFSAGPSPRDVVVGDFDGDGKQDLAVPNVGAGTVSVRLGDGTGAFGPLTSFPVNRPLYPLIAVGDFNGDSKQDLAVPVFAADVVSAGGAFVLLGDGAGGFGLPFGFGIGVGPFALVVGDFNGDGKQDLATANLDSNNVSILLRDCDTTPPLLVLPSDFAVDATSPQGALVTFIASATDNADPHPTVSCTPTSGSTFAIGTTVVQCVATDASHNSVQGSFIVTVNDASTQTANLVALVQSFNLAQGITNSLDAKLQNVLAAFNAANAGNRADACNQLVAFINSVTAQSGNQLTVAQANQLKAKANQIRAVQGCP